MSTVIAKNVQIGADTTATNNFTIYQPATPNGTLLIGNGNTGITSSLVTLTSAGNVGIGTSSPAEKLDVNGGAKISNAAGAGTVSIGSSSGRAQYQYINFGGTVGGTDYGWQVGRSSQGGIVPDGFYFYDIKANATRMAIDASGNLGLGVTPSAWESGFKALQVSSKSSFSESNGAGYFGNNWYANSGSKYIGTGLASLYAQSVGVHSWFTAPSGTAGNAISFTQAMTLDASGNLLVGTTSLITNANCFNYSPGNTWGIFGHETGVASGTEYVKFRYGSSQIGSITQSGTTAVLYNTTSDQRLKENIADADSASALIDSLQVRQYDWKSDGSHQRYGFVAQELLTVAPEAVHQPEDPEAMMAVDYSKLVPMLVKEIQSLRQRLAAAGIA